MNTSDKVGSTLSELLVEIQNSSRWEDAGSAAHWETLGDGKLSSLERKVVSRPVSARREGWVAGDAERMMDGIFVRPHDRTGASFFLSERGLLRGARVQRKTADQQWDNEFIRKCRGCSVEMGLRLRRGHHQYLRW